MFLWHGSLSVNQLYWSAVCSLSGIARTQFIAEATPGVDGDEVRARLEGGAPGRVAEAARGGEVLRALPDGGVAVAGLVRDLIK